MSGLPGTFPEGKQFPENRSQTASQCLPTTQKNGERDGPEKESSVDKVSPTTDDYLWHKLFLSKNGI